MRTLILRSRSNFTAFHYIKTSALSFICLALGPAIVSCGSDVRNDAGGNNESGDKISISISPEGGIFNQDIQVEVTVEPAEAKAYCTTDGTDPGHENGLEYTGELDLTQEGETTVKCVAELGEKTSKVVEEKYVLDKTPPLTSISPGQEIHTQAFEIALSAKDNLDPEPVIVFTLDGSIPDPESSRKYEKPIDPAVELGESRGELLVMYRAMDWAGNIEEVKSKKYTFDYQAPSCTTSPLPGAYNRELDVTINCDEDSSVYYTLDGTDPDPGTSLEYSGLIHLSGEGTTTLKFMAVDRAGNTSEIWTAVYELDFTPPTSSIAPPPGLYNRPISIEFGVSEDTASVYYTTNGTDPVPGQEGTKKYSSPFQLSQEKNYTIKFFAVDEAGNQETPKHNAVYNLDFTGPSCSLVPAGDPQPPGQGFNQDIHVEVSCNEPAVLYYTLDGNDPSESSAKCEMNQTIDIVQEGSIQLKAKALDNAGNWGEVITAWYLLDKTPPASAISPEPGAYKSPLNITLTAQDDLSGASVFFSINDNQDIGPGYGEEFQPGSIVFTKEGFYKVSYRARDDVGNWEAATNTAEYVVDDTPPVTDVAPTGSRSRPGSPFSTLKIYLIATDNHEVYKTYYTLDGTEPGPGSPEWTGEPISIDEEGEVAITVSSVDKAGNKEPPTTYYYVVDKTKPTLTWNFNNGAYKPPITITATCSDNLTGCNIKYTLEYVLLDGTHYGPETKDFVNGLTLSDEGMYSLTLTAVDGAGNSSDNIQHGWFLDGTPPRTTVTPMGSKSLPAKAFNALPLVLDVSVEDYMYDIYAEGGVITKFTTDGTDPKVNGQVYGPDNKPTFSLGGENQVLRIYSEDIAGNTEQEQIIYYTIDITPPTPVLDLSMGELRGRLSWTAPREDLEPTKAASYDIRWSLEPITENNWDDASVVHQLDAEPEPSAPGELEQAVFLGFLPETTYYFALKSRDMAGNESPLSNTASGKFTMRTAEIGPNDFLCRPDIAVLGDVGDGYFNGNRDGLAEFALAAKNENHVAIFYGEKVSTLSFSSLVVTPKDAKAEFGTTLFSGDFNGDSVQDLFVGFTDSGTKGVTYVPVKTDSSNFESGQVDFTNAGTSRGWADGDVNGDGFQDLVMVDASASQALSVFLGNDSPETSLLKTLSIVAPGSYVPDLDSGDFSYIVSYDNANYKLDLYHMDGNDDTYRSYYVSPGARVLSVSHGFDYDGDSAADFALLVEDIDGNTSIKVMNVNSDTVFEPSDLFEPQYVTTGCFKECSQDHESDTLLVLDTMLLYINGQFVELPYIGLYPGRESTQVIRLSVQVIEDYQAITSAEIVGDVNGDGYQDIAAVLNTGRAVILY